MTLRISLHSTRGDFVLDANFETPGRGITAIQGKSGAGKTTLLRAIAGLEPAHGHISVNGHVWLDQDVCLPVHERGVGYVFQEPSLFEHLDVRRNLEFGVRGDRANPHAMTLADVAEILRLGDLLARKTHELSGGERQRVAIGRALLAAPRLLLMDEPLASLDAGHKRELMPFLERLHRELELPVLFVSHLAAEVTRLADYLVLIEGGRTIASGELRDMLTRTDLSLAHEDDAATVVEVTTTGYDDAYGLTGASLGGETLWIPGRVAANAGRLRLRIMARDVSLTLSRQEHTSILNIVPATVAEVAATGTAQCLVRLETAGSMILARLTRRSADSLGLHSGKQVFAQIKTVALVD